MNKKFVDLFNTAALLTLTKEGGAPNEIRIRFGEVPYGRDGYTGVQILNAAYAEGIRQQWDEWRASDPRATAGTPIYIGHPDYTAGSDHEELKLVQQQPPAYGWIVGLRVDVDALVFSVEWTAAGRKLVEDKDYRFISPNFRSEIIDDDGKTTMIPRILKSAGLTNTPNWPQAPLVNAATQHDGGAAKKEHTMTLLERLSKVFGKSFATEDDAVTAVETVNAAAATAEQLTTDNTTLVETVNALRTRYATQVVDAQVKRGAVLQEHAKSRIADLINAAGSLDDRVKELESLPPLMKTAETVNTEKIVDTEKAGAVGRMKIIDMVHAEMTKRGLSYDAAFAAVERDNPDLFVDPTANA